jgi:hypothetical protein
MKKRIQIWSNVFGDPKAIDATYVSILVRETFVVRNGTTFDPTYKYYNLTKCTEEDLPGYGEQLGGTLYADAIYCPDNYDFEIFGNYGS